MTTMFLKCTKKILQDPLRFPDGFDEDAKDLLIKLLNRDPAKRLGANGSSEIKNIHSFLQLSWKEISAEKDTYRHTNHLLKAIGLLKLWVYQVKDQSIV